MDGANLELKHGKAHCQQHKGHGNGHALAAGVKELLHPVQKPAHHRAKAQRKDDFYNGLYYHAQDADLAVSQSAGYTKGYGKQQKANCVVDGHYQHQKTGQRAVGLVLPYHHQRGRRGSGGCNGAQSDGTGHRNHIGKAQMQANQNDIHHHGGNHCLQNANGDGTAAHSLQLMQTEFVTDGKGNKAQGHLSDNTEGLYLLKTVEAQTGHLQQAQAEGP